MREVSSMLYPIKAVVFVVVVDKAKKSRDRVLEGYPSLSAEFFDLTSISAWVEGKTFFPLRDIRIIEKKSNSGNLVYIKQNLVLF